MKPGSKQDGAVVETMAMGAVLPPWLLVVTAIGEVEALVVTAAALLLLQLILGCCKRRWHNSFLKYGLQVCTKLMDPLIVYTLGKMCASPFKNLYPVWAAFLLGAKEGTTAVQEHEFLGSFHSKYVHVLVETFGLFFYSSMIGDLVLDPTWDLRHNKDSSLVSSLCVYVLAATALGSQTSKLFSFIIDDIMKYKEENKKRRGGKGDSYLALEGSITMDHIWAYCPDSNDGNQWKELCLSYALFQQLLKRRYFGVAIPEAILLKTHDVIFKKLPPQGDSKAAFKTVEVELGFCYDFFFTKYHRTFKTRSDVAVLLLLKISLTIVVGVLVIRKSLALDTTNPIIQVQTSEADRIDTLLVLGIALLVELVQTAFYLASDWAQVSLACSYVEWREKDIGFIGKAIGFLRRFIVSGALRKKMKQYSLIFGPKDEVDVSDAVKGAIARSLTSTCGKPTVEDTSLRQIKMFDWTFTDHSSQLEVMLIWHIATEYCDMSDGHRDGITQDEQGVATKFSVFWASLIGQVNGFTPCSDRDVGVNLVRLCAGLIEYISPSYRRYQRNVVARDGHRSVAVHLSRYFAYLIGSVPELLPYHKAYIAELADKMMEEDREVFGSLNKYVAVKYLEETEEDHNPTNIVRKGVKLGKQLDKMAEEDRWKVMEDFWADAIIHAAALRYTTKQHMQHLENGGEFLTHIWTLLAHVGILDEDKDQQGRGVRIPALRVPVKQEADLALTQRRKKLHV